MKKHIVNLFIALALLTSLLGANVQNVKAEGEIPPIPNRAEVEQFAEVVAQLLVFNPDGTVTLRDADVELNEEQITLLNRFVSDVNDGKIGFAVQKEEQTLLYGKTNEDEVSSGFGTYDSYYWTDTWGVHLYLDDYWTGLLLTGTGWAIGIIVGVIVTPLLGWGGAVILDAIWNIIWYNQQYNWPTSLNIHFSYPQWQWFDWWGWHYGTYTYIQKWGNGYNGDIEYIGYYYFY